VCCTFLLAFGIGPRIALIFVWIFGDRVQLAFDSFIWPLLGLLFLPWTTLLYVLVWQVGGLSGWGWFVVGLGVLLDLGTYLGRAGYQRAGYT
jgi:hypothetical protein